MFDILRIRCGFNNSRIMNHGNTYKKEVSQRKIKLVTPVNNNKSKKTSYFLFHCAENTF